MFDEKFYGIIVGQAKVMINKRRAAVTGVKRSVFSVEFSVEDDELRELMLKEVLKFAETGQGVVSLEDAQREFVVFLCTSFAIVNSFMPQFHKWDPNKKNTTGV